MTPEGDGGCLNSLSVHGEEEVKIDSQNSVHVVCTRPQINDWRVPFADEKTQYVPLLSFDASEQYCYV